MPPPVTREMLRARPRGATRVQPTRPQPERPPQATRVIRTPPLPPPGETPGRQPPTPVPTARRAQGTRLIPEVRGQPALPAAQLLQETRVRDREMCQAPVDRAMPAPITALLLVAPVTQGQLETPRLIPQPREQPLLAIPTRRRKPSLGTPVRQAAPPTPPPRLPAAETQGATALTRAPAARGTCRQLTASPVMPTAVARAGLS